MYLMTVISMERFAIFYKPILVRNMNLNTRLYIIMACAVLSFVWSALPLVGWSHYSMEACRTTCAVEWAERSLSVTSYNLAIFIFVFLIPLVVLVFSNSKLILCMHQLHRRRHNSNRLKASDSHSSLSKSTNAATSSARKASEKTAAYKSIKITVILIVYMRKKVIHIVSIDQVCSN